jgi:hypothetical protein
MRNTDARRHIGHGITAFGHLLDCFDLEFFRVPLAA